MELACPSSANARELFRKIEHIRTNKPFSPIHVEAPPSQKFAYFQGMPMPDSGALKKKQRFTSPQDLTAAHLRYTSDD